MNVFAIMIVRNEADILRINVLHHLSVGINQFLIVDNDSSDGTDEILRRLSADRRVEWTRCHGAFRQAELTTKLAHEAYLRGADWIIPIDADEFWYAPGGDLREQLAATSAGALQVRVLNFIQRREQFDTSSRALLHMTRRAPHPIGPVERVQELVEGHKIGFVELSYQGKWISRATFANEIHQGNHTVGGLSGPLEQTENILCLHAPLRSRSVLESKADPARPDEELRAYLAQAWHIRRWRRLAQNGQLDMEWAANSYDGEYLDVYGVQHRLEFDPSLRDLVKPWIESAAWQGQSVSTPVAWRPPPHLPSNGTRAPGLFGRDGVTSGGTDHGGLADEQANLLLAAATLSLIESDALPVLVMSGGCTNAEDLVRGVVATISPDVGVFEVKGPTAELESFGPVGLLVICMPSDALRVESSADIVTRCLAPGGYAVVIDHDSSAVSASSRIERFLRARQYEEVGSANGITALRKPGTTSMAPRTLSAASS
jgi:glycosyltransferase involved in cell wall biosynthesis